MTDTSRVHVREARPADVDAVVDVGRRAWVVGNGGLVEPDVAQLMLDKWWTPEACLPSIVAKRTLVAELDGRIGGVLAYGPHRGAQVVWKLYVAPEAQRHGLGTHLLRAVIARADGLGDDVFVGYHDGAPGVEQFLAGLGFSFDHREGQSGVPDLIWTRRPCEGALP